MDMFMTSIPLTLIAFLILLQLLDIEKELKKLNKKLGKGE